MYKKWFKIEDPSKTWKWKSLKNLLIQSLHPPKYDFKAYMSTEGSNSASPLDSNE